MVSLFFLFILLIFSFSNYFSLFYIGIKPEIQVLDITNKEAQAEAYNNIIQKHKKIDVLILNSGQSQRQVAVDAPLEDTKYLMNLNFFSYVSLTKLALPQMLEQKSGKVRFFHYPFSFILKFILFFSLCRLLL